MSQQMTFSKKEYNDKNNARRLRFLGKRIVLSFIPRTGKCSKCGKKGATDMHHLKYIPCIPWACTKELCDKCHGMKFK